MSTCPGTGQSFRHGRAPVRRRTWGYPRRPAAAASNRRIPLGTPVRRLAAPEQSRTSRHSFLPTKVCLVVGIVAPMGPGPGRPKHSNRKPAGTAASVGTPQGSPRDQRRGRPEGVRRPAAAKRCGGAALTSGPPRPAGTTQGEGAGGEGVRHQEPADVPSRQEQQHQPDQHSKSNFNNIQTQQPPTPTKTFHAVKQLHHQPPTPPSETRAFGARVVPPDFRPQPRAGARAPAGRAGGRIRLPTGGRPPSPNASARGGKPMVRKDLGEGGRPR